MHTKAGLAVDMSDLETRIKAMHVTPSWARQVGLGLDKAALSQTHLEHHVVHNTAGWHSLSEWCMLRVLPMHG